MSNTRRMGLVFLLFAFLWITNAAVALGEEQESEPSEVIKNVVVVTVVGPETSKFTIEQTPTIYGLGKEGIDLNGVIHPAFTTANEVIEYFVSTSTHSNLANVYQSMSRKTLLSMSSPSTSLHKQFNYSTQSLKDFNRLFTKERPFFSVLSLQIGKDGLNSVREADSVVAKLIGQIHNLELYENTILVVVGIETGAKGVNVGDAVIKGVNLKNGYDSPVCQLKDIAPTLLFVTDGKLVKNGQGQILWPLLKVDSLQLENNLLQKRIVDLANSQSALLQDLYDFERTSNLLTREKQQLNKEKSMIHSEINIRDRKINSLTQQRNAIIFGFSGVIILLLIGYVLEYFVLRKRFLIF